MIKFYITWENMIKFILHIGKHDKILYYTCGNNYNLELYYTVHVET